MVGFVLCIYRRLRFGRDEEAEEAVGGRMDGRGDHDGVDGDGDGVGRIIRCACICVELEREDGGVRIISSHHIISYS